jgi:hypothetical protein
MDEEETMAELMARLRRSQEQGDMRAELYEQAADRRHDEQMAALGRIAAALEKLAVDSG